MRNIEKQTWLAKKLLEYALSCPPARMGMRLQPESELSRILGLGRNPVSTSLNKLSEEGILIRRRGSGTFVRKVASYADGNRVLWGQYVAVDSSRVFAGELSVVAKAETLGCGRQRLNIGLWGDWDEPSGSQLARIKGMRAALQSQGHYLTLHSVMHDRNTLLSPRKLEMKIRESGCCGYLVVALRAAIFLEATGGEKLPVVFCGVNSECGFQPSVTQSYKSTYNQALAIFRQSGFTRIGVVGIMDRNMLILENQLRTYFRAMEDEHLSYRDGALFIDVDEDERESVERIRMFLTGTDRPDAVYVSDDTLLLSFRKALKQSGLQAGRDIGVICLVNEQNVSNVPKTWSRMVFDQEMIGRTAAEELLKIISDSSFRPGNIKFLPNWIPRQTHLKLSYKKEEPLNDL